MNAGFYTGVSGMVAFQREMDVTANNIANVNTVGFKPSRVSFGDLFYTQMDTHEGAGSTMGHGVKAQSADLTTEAGLYEQTQQALDFAIVGDGYFAIERGDANTVYTRNGSFKIGVEKQKSYLTTSAGDYVLNASGKRIEISRMENSNLPDLSEIKESIGLFSFANPLGLEPAENSCFKATDRSGIAQAQTNNKKSSTEGNITLMSGALENSAVDLTKEMVNVIQSQRAFQFNAKIVQVSDQIEEIINNLR